MSSPAAYTIPHFCTAYFISRAHYYALKEKGLTPQEIRLGRRIIITRRAAEEWEERMAALQRPRPVPEMIAL